MRIRSLLFLILFALTFVISGCGGSGDEPKTEIPPSNAIAVDPYLHGATFTEYNADGEEVQISHDISAADGSFLFLMPLTPGSTVIMNTTAGVRHVTFDGGSMPYNGPLLKRIVSENFAEGDLFIVSPITTLATLMMERDGITEETAIAQVVELLTEAGFAGVTTENALSDPMAWFANGATIDKENMEAAEIAAIQATLNSTLAQASMALSTALKYGLPNDNALDDTNAFDQVFAATAAMIKVAMANATGQADINDLLRAGAIVTDEILQIAAWATTYDNKLIDQSSNVAPVAYTQEDKIKLATDRAEELVEWLENPAGSTTGAEALVAAIASLGDGQTIDAIDTTQPLPVAKDYQALFDAAFNDAITATTSDLQSPFSFIYADWLIADAKHWDIAKSIYDEAAANNFTITVPANDLDLLHFYYAMSRVMLLANPLSDSNPDNGLQKLGDILDALEVDPDAALRGSEDYGLEECISDPLLGLQCNSTIFPGDPAYAPATTPTSGELQGFLYQVAAQELIKAIASLGEISTTFQHFQTIDGDLVDTEFDYSDALFLKAYANSLLFQIHLQQGLVIDTDIKAIAENSTMTVQEFLAANPGFLAIKDPAALAKAREYASVALKGMDTAIDIVTAEADSQLDDLIAFYDADPILQQEEIDLLKSDIADAQGTLYGQKTFAVTGLKDSDRNLHDVSVLVSLKNLFDGMVSLDALLPSYSGNLPGLLPDATLGGMVVDAANSPDPLYLNADSSKDGSPNKIEYAFYDPTDYNGEWTCWTYYSDSNGVCEGQDVSWVIYNDAGTVKIDYKNGTDWQWDSATGLIDPTSCVTGDAGLHTTDITSEVQEADLVNLWYTDAEISGTLSGASSSIYDPFTDFYVEYFYLNGGVYSASCYRELD